MYSIYKSSRDLHLHVSLFSIYAVVNLHSIATAIVAFFNAIVESVNQTYKFGYFFPNI